MVCRQMRDTLTEPGNQTTGGIPAPKGGEGSQKRAKSQEGAMSGTKADLGEVRFFKRRKACKGMETSGSAKVIPEQGTSPGSIALRSAAI